MMDEQVRDTLRDLENQSAASSFLTPRFPCLSQIFDQFTRKQRKPIKWNKVSQNLLISGNNHVFEASGIKVGNYARSFFYGVFFLTELVTHRYNNSSMIIEISYSSK